MLRPYGGRMYQGSCLKMRFFAKQLFFYTTTPLILHAFLPSRHVTTSVFLCSPYDSLDAARKVSQGTLGSLGEEEKSTPRVK